MRQLFGEYEGITDETGDALSSCVIEALDVIGFPGVLRDGFVLRCRNGPGVDGILVGREHCLVSVDRRKIGPQLFRTVVTAVSYVEGHDLACLLIHGDPHPLFVGFFRHEAPHLIRFHLQPADEHITRRCHRLHMEMIRQGRKAGDEKTHQPPDTHAHRTTNAMQGGLLTE